MYRGLYYDSGVGGADYGGGSAGGGDSGANYDAGVGGANYGGNTGASGSDAWQGWEAEIGIHSAGLEQYTAPSEAGQPGITTLTDAGLAALGITREQAPITYSWGAPLAEKAPVILPSYNIMGLDLTGLLQSVINSISVKIDSLTKGVNDVTKLIVEPVKEKVDQAIKQISDTAGSILSGVTQLGIDIGQNVTQTISSIKDSIGQIGYDAGQYLSALFDPLLRSVRDGLAYVQNALTQITNTVTTTIQNATREASAAVQVGLSQVTSGLTEIQADLAGLPELIALFQAPELFGDFLIKALAAAWVKEV
ncbi:MAG: hypothetical protein WC749_07690 [Dehalococcoidia bacterium]